MMEMTKILNKAGITIGEFAGFAGVTRASVHKWMKGGEMHPLREARVNKLLDAIKRATDNCEFPLELRNNRYDLDEKKARASKLKAVIIEYLKKAA